MYYLKKHITLNSAEAFKAVGDRLGEYLALFYGIEAEKAAGNLDSKNIREIEIADIILKKGNLEAEHFALYIEKNVIITAGDIKGAIYGISTFLQMIDSETLGVEMVHFTEGPYKKMRGMHLYLPARGNIEIYKRILDTMVFFKMNTVIIEVGGAMEYEKHPEINEKWEWFCHFADFEFPGIGRSRSVQWSDTYWKDSIHTEHAGGSYLTKAEVRNIVHYAKSLGLTVIPEIQALSHSYYLTLAHREIAELQDDMFPDSYCPLNEKSYELYFEVAEEVLEVFEPDMVSIGHDEIRVLGECEKCREKTSHELLAYELNRLHEFYAKRNIRMVMWGEMLLHYQNYKGVWMGEKRETVNEYGFRHVYPEGYHAKDYVSKDILMLNWQYSRDHKTEQYYEEDGFQSLFGNFEGSKILNWSKRSASDNMLGAEVSTWVVADEDTFAKDGIFFEMAFSANMLWENGYDNDKYEKMTEKVIRQMYFTKGIMRGEASMLFSGADTEVIYTGEKERAFAKLDLTKAKEISAAAKRAADQFGDTVYGVSADAVNLLIKKEFKADGLVFLHTAKKDMEYIPSHRFPDYAPLGLCAYVVLYEDGTIETVNAVFGRTIGNSNFEIKCGDGSEEAENFTIDDALEEKKEGLKAPTFAPKSQWFGSILYDCVPFSDGAITAFLYEWKNPHPEKKIVKMRAINTCQDVEQSAVLFGISAIRCL